MMPWQKENSRDRIEAAGMKFRPDKNQIKWGITIFLTAVCILLFSFIVYKGSVIAHGLSGLMGNLMAIIAGIIIAFILSPILNFIERYILAPIYRHYGIDVFSDGNYDKNRQMRKISIFITMTIFVLALYALIIIIVPQVVESLKTIIRNLPVYGQNIEDFMRNLFRNDPQMQKNANEIIDKVQSELQLFTKNKILPEIGSIMQKISQFAIRIVTGILNFIIGAIVSVYLMYQKENLSGQFKKICYAFFSERIANEAVGECRFIYYTFIGFITGKLLDSLIIGVLCFIGTKMIGTPFPMLVSFIVGVTNIIPFFGPYLGAFFGCILVFMIDPLQALFLLIFIIILQQFDGNILGPKILGDSTGLSSFWVIFAIMFFGAVWGLVGWIIGVPVFAVLYHLLARIVNHFLRVKKLPDSLMTFRSTAYIENGKIHSSKDPSSTRFFSQKRPSAWTKFFRK